MLPKPLTPAGIFIDTSPVFLNVSCLPRKARLSGRSIETSDVQLRNILPGMASSVLFSVTSSSEVQPEKTPLSLPVLLLL